MIKLFISDFDGTLLDDMHMLSEETTQAIHALRASGVSFMPASGRDYTAIQQIMQPIGVKVKCIALNGGEFFDNAGKVLISYKLAKEKTLEVHKIIDKYDVITDYYLENDRVTLVQNNVKATYLDYYMRSAKKPMKDILHLFRELDFDNVVVSVNDINRVAEVGVVKIESQFADLEERRK
ncbi:MAG: HAD-IIB family hydrolase [Erysipelotrichia bacterium]|nr:HAD-IIB family hydrolase [Erysipelotrichia bacterium]